MSQAGEIQYGRVAIHYVNKSNDAEVKNTASEKCAHTKVGNTFITYQRNRTNAGYKFRHGGNDTEEKHPYPDPAEPGFFSNDISIPGCFCPGKEDTDDTDQEFNPDQ